MKTLITIAALAALTLQAEDYVATKTTGTVNLASVSTTTHITGFDFYDDSGKLVLEITINGEIKFGEGVTPTKAARQFAIELKRQWKDICVSSPKVKATYDLGSVGNAWNCDDSRYRDAMASGLYRKGYCRESTGKVIVQIGETK